MFNIKVDDSKVTLFVDFANRRMVQYVKQGITKAGVETAQYIKVRHLTGGTTSDRLGVRTGLLRKAAHGLKPIESGDRVIGGAGLGDGLVYAPVHINREGTKTTITPKNSKYLTVPFRSWQSRSGSMGYGPVKRPSARDYSKGFLRVIKTKSGKLMLAHVTWSKGTKKKKGAFGKSAYGGSRTVVPYYMLLKKVVVPARVYPERIAIVRRRFIVETIKNEMVKALKRK